MTGGIYFRVVLLVTGLAAILLAVQLVTDSVIETRKAQQSSKDEAISIANVVARGLEKQFEYFDLSELEGILSSVRERENVLQVMAVDRYKTFFLDGDRLTPTLLAESEVPQLDAAMQSGELSFAMDAGSIVVGEPLKRDGQVIGAIMLRFEYPNFSTIAQPIIYSNLAFSIPVLLLGAILSLLLARQITGPLGRLSDAASAVAAGDLDAQIPIDGPSETRKLGTAFSLMIGKLKDNIEQVYELAFVDKTTRLPNREFFRKELTRSIKRSLRQEKTGALLFVDLDGFKRVNDTHGHDVGDVLLEEFAKRLVNLLRAEDLVAFKPGNAIANENADYDEHTEDEGKSRQVLARLGGDEFTVLLSEIREATDAAIVCQRIIEAVSVPFTINGSDIRIGASIGIATFPNDGEDYQTILKNADMAMYQAKEEGKNTYRYFSQELNEEASRRMMIEHDLRKALEADDQLELYYQPKIDTRTGVPRSVEALIRWKHPEKGMIQPLEFINVAEDCGLILPLGKWILEEACRQINRFQELGLDLSIAVNISTAQFSGTSLSQVVKDALAETGASADLLELELTESMAMQNPEMALHHIGALKEIGVRFAIDDFGTGYSNLSQLSQIPFDVFKIDRSFVDMLTNDQCEHGQAIVRTVLAMAKSLNYETVAEGIENKEQLDFLTEFGCNHAQGYYFAKPMPEKQLLEWYGEWMLCGLKSLFDKSKSAIVTEDQRAFSMRSSAA